MEELNTFEKTLPNKLDFLIKLKQFVSLEKNSLEKISLAVIFLELMQKNGKSAEIKRINGLEYVYENLTGYYFLVSSKKSGNCYDYIIKIFHEKLFPNGVIDKIIGDYFSFDSIKERAEYLLSRWIKIGKLDFYVSLLDFENINLKMEKLKVENKWKLIIYENIKTSYIKDYYLDTEETLYCDIFLEKLKIEPLYDKIQYNEFLKNISPLLKKELLDIDENYEIEILVDKYPITNNKMQFLDDEMDIYITKNDSKMHPLESYPEIYFRDTVNSWKKCEFMKSRKQKIFILNIELSDEKWKKLPEFKIMPKIEHKNIVPPVFKKIENNIFDIVYIPRDWDDDDLGFSISEELLKKMIGLGYDVEIISNKDRFFNTHSPYKLKTEKDILWVYDYENNWYILPLLDFDTLERKVIDGEVITYTTTSVQVYHEKYCPDGKLYFQKSEIKDYGISDAIHLGFGEWVVNEYQKLIESYKSKI